MSGLYYSVWVFLCNAHAHDSHPGRAHVLAQPFLAVKENSAWYFAVLVKDECSWNDSSLQVSVLSVQTSSLLLLHGDQMHLTPEVQQTMR